MCTRSLAVPATQAFHPSTSSMGSEYSQSIRLVWGMVDNMRHFYESVARIDIFRRCSDGSHLVERKAACLVTFEAESQDKHL